MTFFSRPFARRPKRQSTRGQGEGQQEDLSGSDGVDSNQVVVYEMTQIQVLFGMM